MDGQRSLLFIKSCVSVLGLDQTKLIKSDGNFQANKIAQICRSFVSIKSPNLKSFDILTKFHQDRGQKAKWKNVATVFLSPFSETSIRYIASMTQSFQRQRFLTNFEDSLFEGSARSKSYFNSQTWTMKSYKYRWDVASDTFQGCQMIDLFQKLPS